MIRVVRDPDRGRYRIMYAVVHAPAGGATVGGKQFTGGEFIPGDVLARATPAEKAQVAGTAPAPAPPQPAPAPAPPAPAPAPAAPAGREFAPLEGEYNDNRYPLHRAMYDWEVESYAGWIDGLSGPEKEAINGYVDGGIFAPMNLMLRGGAAAPAVAMTPGHREAIVNQMRSLPPGTDYKAAMATIGADDRAAILDDARQIDAALDRARIPEAVIAYRGARDPAALGIDRANAASLVGSTLVDDGFMSLALDPDAAGKFLGRRTTGVLFRVSVPAGARVAGVGAAAYRGQRGVDPEEMDHEILPARGHGLKVTGVTTTHRGTLLVDADLVDLGGQRS